MKKTFLCDNRTYDEAIFIKGANILIVPDGKGFYYIRDKSEEVINIVCPAAMYKNREEEGVDVKDTDINTLTEALKNVKEGQEKPINKTEHPSQYNAIKEFWDKYFPKLQRKNV